MAVTELVWLTAPTVDFIPECKQATDHALDVRGRWCAENAPDAPKGRDNWGVALFQQVEDPAIYLLTTHFKSIAQHQQWLNSTENATELDSLRDHFTLEKTIRCLLEEAVFTSSSASGPTKTLLQSPVISVGRCSVAHEHREKFSKNRQGVRGSLDEFAMPYPVKDTWKLEDQEKDQEKDQELVSVCGWPSVERHMEFAKTDGFPKYMEAHQEFAKGFDVKHYRRVL